MAIIRCVDLSTGHVPANFAKLKIPFRRVKHEYGWILYLRSEKDLEAEDIIQLGRHKFLDQIFAYAKKHKCDMVNLDADAEVIEGLQRFDW